MRLIDADALKKLLQNLAHDDWNQITCTTWAEAFEEVADMIDGTPTADVVERKNGKWIVYYECPKCGEITKDFTEYCPFCNADLRGEEEEDE